MGYSSRGYPRIFSPCRGFVSSVGLLGGQKCQFRDSIVVSISACHADDPGSIPGRGVFRFVGPRNSLDWTPGVP